MSDPIQEKRNNAFNKWYDPHETQGMDMRSLRNGFDAGYWSLEKENNDLTAKLSDAQAREAKLVAALQKQGEWHRWQMTQYQMEQIGFIQHRQQLNLIDAALTE